MPLTLVQARENMTDHFDKSVIDEFRKSTHFLDSLPFDDTAMPNSSGSSWDYSYQRVTTQATAGTRAINADYSASQALTTKRTGSLAIAGGKFDMDRVLQDTGYAVDNFIFQFQQKIKATIAELNDLIINGSLVVDANAFDGLDVALTGSTTEYGTTGVIDLSSAADVKANWEAFRYEINKFRATMAGRPTFFLMNGDLKAAFVAMAQYAGAYSSTPDSFGNMVEAFDGIPLVDMLEKSGSSSPVIGNVGRTVSAVPYTGLTDFYAVRYGFDAFHGIAPASGQNFFRSYVTPTGDPGVNRVGALEVLMAIALKASKSCGVFRNLKVV